MIPSYQDIVALLKKGATVEAQEKIMELREAVMNLQDDNHSLRDKVRALEEELRKRHSLSFDDGVYWQWLENEAGDMTDKDGPYCQRCYDDEQKLLRLQPLSTAMGPMWYCTKCKTHYDRIKS